MTGNTGPKLLSVGAATLDTIFRLERLPTGSGKYIPIEAIEIAAGMASSAALAAARLGRRRAFVLASATIARVRS